MWDKSCWTAYIGLVGLGVATAGSTDTVLYGLGLLGIAVLLALIPDSWFK